MSARHAEPGDRAAELPPGVAVAPAVPDFEACQRELIGAMDPLFYLHLPLERCGALVIDSLRDVPVVPNIDAAILAASGNGAELDMTRWHCGTTHCRYGWAIVLAGAAGRALERATSTLIAATLIYAVSRPGRPVPDYWGTNEATLADLRHCAALEGAR